MSDRGAENVFLRLRWPETDGKPVCPSCGCWVCYDCRRPAGQARWRCKACGADFSVTSGTLFAWHKLPLRTYLMAIAVFCNEVKGKSMLAFARDLDVQYKTAFVLAHKLREAMASSTKAIGIGGEGRTAEIDGAYFGGHIRPENLAIDRIDRRLAENRSGKRQVVVAMRERGGRTHAGAGFPGRGGCRGDDPPAGCERHHGSCRREHGVEPAARQLRHAADQPPGRLQHRRRLHQWSRILFLPAAPRRTRTSPPHRRAVSRPLRPGSSLARGPPPRR